MAWGERRGRSRAFYTLERGPRTAQSVKDPERRKCAKSLEMLYCRSGGQDADGDRLWLADNNIPLSIPNPLIRGWLSLPPRSGFATIRVSTPAPTSSTPTPTPSSHASPPSGPRQMSTVSLSLLLPAPAHPPTAYDDGRTQLLLCLHGTLPIAFRQASYNIPVAIWVPREYPKHPPIAYVVATTEMLIRSSQYIDLSGRCNIEYIRNWQRKSEVRAYPVLRSPNPALIPADSRVVASSVSWRPCRPTSPKSPRSTRNPRTLRLPSLSPLRSRPTVIPQNLLPRSPVHNFNSLDRRQIHLFLPPHHHHRWLCYRQQITLADRPFLRNLVRHHPGPQPPRLRRSSNPPFPRCGIPHE